MRYDLNILWVEDTATYYEETKEILETYAEDNGISLKFHYIQDVNVFFEKIKNNEKGFRLYDIFFIDYSLSSGIDRLVEVDESVAKAAEERAKEKAKAEDGAGSDSTGQGDKNDGGTDSAGQSDKNDGGTGSAGQSDKSGGTGSDEDKSGMGTLPDMDGSSGGDQTPPDMSGASTDIESTEQSGQNQAPSDMGSTSTDTESTEQSGQMQMPPDMDSTEMPQGAPGGMSDMTGETVTTMIPVGVTVHTTSDTTTTFSRLASGDLLKILVETDSDGNEIIEEIWMLQ